MRERCCADGVDVGLLAKEEARAALEPARMPCSVTNTSMREAVALKSPAVTTVIACSKRAAQTDICSIWAKVRVCAKSRLQKQGCIYAAHGLKRACAVCGGGACATRVTGKNGGGLDVGKVRVEHILLMDLVTHRVHEKPQ